MSSCLDNIRFQSKGFIPPHLPAFESVMRRSLSVRNQLITHSMKPSSTLKPPRIRRFRREELGQPDTVKVHNQEHENARFP